MKSKPLVFFCLVILAVPTLSYAADFLPLVGIPGVTNAGNAGFGAYINALYRLSISIAALLAVIKIVAAGAKYMLSDIVTSKESAKDDIRGALIGLLIIIGAVVILTTINSDITENNFVIAPLDGADPTPSSFDRLVSRLEAAIANCEANPNCVVRTGETEEWCTERQGQFIEGRWFALGDATFRDRCFYDPANVPNGESDLPPLSEGLDPNNPADLNQLNYNCQQANSGEGWYYENGRCVQGSVVTQPIPGGEGSMGYNPDNPADYNFISAQCQSAYGLGYTYNPSLRLCASRE